MSAYWSDMYDRPTCVYRLYACDGTLLYVGLSKNPRGRLSQHVSKEWWPEVDYSTVEWFGDRETAKAIERHAIRDENPLYNATRPRLECC